MTSRLDLVSRIARYHLADVPAFSLRDPFVLSSCLQKALRRGDRLAALAAARTLLICDPARLWRRLVVCALEDFGLSDLSATADVVVAAKARFRALIDDDWRVAGFAVDRLLACPRDRRTDHAYMLGFAINRGLLPELSGLPPVLGPFVSEVARLLAVCETQVPKRSFLRLNAGPSDEALRRMAHEGLCDQALLGLCLEARLVSRCVLAVLLPLCQAASLAVSSMRVVQEARLAPVPLIGGVPAYSWDGHTRAGRAILERLVRSEPCLRTALAGLSAHKARTDAAASLLFLVEGGLCSREWQDPFYDALKIASRGCLTGLGPDRLEPAVAAMTALLPQIHDMRAAVVAQE